MQGVGLTLIFYLLCEGLSESRQGRRSKGPAWDTANHNRQPSCTCPVRLQQRGLSQFAAGQVGFITGAVDREVPVGGLSPASKHPAHMEKTERRDVCGECKTFIGSSCYGIMLYTKVSYQRQTQDWQQQAVGRLHVARSLCSEGGWHVDGKCCGSLKRGKLLGAGHVEFNWSGGCFVVHCD